MIDIGPIGLVIFARMDSSRLPGKALMDIAGRPMLGRVLDCCREARRVDTYIIATSDRAVDNPIQDFAETEGAAVFRGDGDDVLGRACAAAEAHGLTHLVRISGDSPFMRSDVIDAIVEVHLASGAEITTNIAPRTFPPGLSVEALTRQALQRLDREAVDAEDREHVTRFVYRHADTFDVHNVESGHVEWADCALTVDTGDDLEFARRLAERIDAAPGAPLGDWVAMADEERQPAPAAARGLA